jgi:hypothetical protein
MASIITESSENCNYTMRTVRLLFTILILALAGWLVHANWPDISKSFDLPATTFALALTLALTNLGIAAEQLRWCFQKETRERLTPTLWFRYYVAGRLANTVLAESGTIYRAWHLKISHSIFIHQFVAANAFSAWMNLLFMIAVATGTIPFVTFAMGINTVVATVILVFAFSTLLSMPRLLQGNFTTKLLNQIKANRVGHFSNDLLSVFQEVSSSQKNIAIFTFLAILQLCLNTWLVYLIGSSLLEAFTLGQAIFISLFMKLSTLVSLTPGNIGIRELVLELTMRLITDNATLGTGTLLSLILRAIGLTVVGPMGAIFLVLENKKK